MDSQATYGGQPGKKRSVRDTIAATVWILIFVIIFVFILEIAWNNTMPHIFSVGKIDFWQSLLLVVVARILFPPSMGQW
ncbi:MAG: hypothetical protein Harvfovirus4_12 [Harvfovirus sp.]|uniref:Uncharacterized protein n=1 Tax=Harvfovirus sp. TaxID=2487768 RepID=A0A3G5A0D7_9VIRU|nr:MAG: hypothetical protein Harvfovirus4_12 [Harvfovirus sp.]